MAGSMAPADCARVLVAIPNWVGDVVLATPVLAALRRHFRGSTICFLMRRYLAELLDGCGWNDEALHPPVRGAVDGAAGGSLVRALRRGRYDLALLLTNSFRSALTVWLGGVRRRVGYAREARSVFLTDRLRPPRAHGEFVPHPMLDYYSRLAERVGCPVTDRRLTLGITPEQQARGEALKRHYGFGDGRPYAVVNPGAAFGAAKCWPAERFSRLCERLSADRGLTPVIVGAPREAPLMRTIADGCGVPVCCLDDPGTTLGSLKVIVRDAALLVCNDTGPRHFGNAFGVPTVTIFGPTHQAWTDTDYAGEVRLQVPVECGPCMLRVCPIDHRCMTRVTVDMVMAAVGRLLDQPARTAVGAACGPAGA